MQLNKQDKKFYTSSPEESIKDIKQIVQDVYNKDYKLPNIVTSQKIIDAEIEDIIKVKQKNAKLLLFALLVHNKKYSQLGETFYMSYSQMSNATGLSEKTCINQLKNLVEQNYVKVVARKVPNDNEIGYKPNYYKLLIGESIKGSAEDCNSITLNYNDENIREPYLRALAIIDDEILKEYLPKKDYYSFKKGNYIKL